MPDSHRTIMTKGKRRKRARPVVALIAHDAKKVDMVIFSKEEKERITQCDLIATGSTSEIITEKTGLQVKRMLHGPEGGDLQIGGLVASGEVDLVIFLRDPLTAQPHDPDISALLRVCDVHNIPLATNLNSAKLLLTGLIKVNIEK
jgi:methylglyoxal synthase